MRPNTAINATMRSLPARPPSVLCTRTWPTLQARVAFHAGTWGEIVTNWGDPCKQSAWPGWPTQPPMSAVRMAMSADAVTHPDVGVAMSVPTPAPWAVGDSPAPARIAAGEGLPRPLGSQVSAQGS